jgi:hypothetical protein
MRLIIIVIHENFILFSIVVATDIIPKMNLTVA